MPEYNLQAWQLRSHGSRNRLHNPHSRSCGAIRGQSRSPWLSCVSTGRYKELALDMSAMKRLPEAVAAALGMESHSSL